MTALTNSIVTGRVTAQNGGVAIRGALIAYSGAFIGSTTTDGNGNYTLILTDGTYHIQASALGYTSSSSVTVGVPPNATAVNFALVSPRVRVTPSSLAAIQEEDTLTTQSLTVTNDGDAPLTFSVNPVEASPVYGTIHDLKKVSCTGSVAGSPECFTFTTSLYTDYTADPDTALTINSALTGTNLWTVFEPKSNEYSTGISVLMHGENHGWTTAKGTLIKNIGSYDYPFTLP